MGTTNKMFYLGEGSEAEPPASATIEMDGQIPTTPPPTYSQSQSGQTRDQNGHPAPRPPPALPPGHSIYRSNIASTTSTPSLATANYPRQPMLASGLVNSASSPGLSIDQNSLPSSPPPPPNLQAVQVTANNRKTTCLKVAGGLGAVLLILWFAIRLGLRLSFN